jgi:6-pyruvoyltetrahydropterin/6-carboxytetrahydropterin synthase
VYSITKDFGWSASHQLGGLPAAHPCARLHGHNYVARIEVAGDQLDETGFVVDFGDLGFVREYIDTQLDHRHLNDVLPFNPTAENLARHLADVARRGLTVPDLLVSASVSETPKTWARWTP